MTNDPSNFTEHARKVLDLAQDEARRFHNNYVGTEHILLALVQVPGGIAVKVLANSDIGLHKIRRALEFIIGGPVTPESGNLVVRGEAPIRGELGLTPGAKKVIELSIDEKRMLNHHYLGTEHLLLGLVREGEGIAAGVLEGLGLSLSKARAEVIRELSSLNPAMISNDIAPSTGSGINDSHSSKSDSSQHNKQKDETLAQSHVDFIGLSQIIRDRLDEDSFRHICVYISEAAASCKDLEYSDLAGSGWKSKTTSLYEYCKKRKALQTMIEVVNHVRPDVLAANYPLWKQWAMEKDSI